MSKIENESSTLQVFSGNRSSIFLHMLSTYFFGKGFKRISSLSVSSILRDLSRPLRSFFKFSITVPFLSTSCNLDLHLF